MSLSLQNKGLIKTAVAVAVALGATQVAQANSAEIQQLRAEVEQLRQAVQQSGASNKGVSVSTKSGTDVKFYGNVRIDGTYITKGPDSQWQNIAESREEVKNTFRATPTASRFGFDFATPVGGEKVTGKIEGDFRGSSSSNGSLRVRHAYFNYGNWTIGQTTSLFAGDNVPATVDFTGAIGDNDVGRSPQIRYTLKPADATKVEVAIERGQFSKSTEDITSLAASATGSKTTYTLPAITARVTQSYGDKGSASVRGIVENYKAAALDKKATGFAVGFGANYEVVDGLKVMGDLNYGRGINATLGTSTAYNVSGGKINKNEYSSFVGGVSYDITDQVNATAGYGLMKFKDSGAYAKSLSATATSNVANKTLQQAWVNVTYSPVKPVEFGAEYMIGEREVFNGKTFKDSRVNLMAKYKF